MDKKQKYKTPSELRFDLISRDWVVIATGRAKRPETFKQERRKTDEMSQAECPFCNIETQEKPVLIYSPSAKISEEEMARLENGNGIVPKDWTIVVIPNKYPAFTPCESLDKEREGRFYQRMNAAGYHEVLVTRDHKKSMGQFEIKEIKEIIDAYQERYLNLMKKTFVNYVSIFHNHGREAGASIAHPHSQIITTPLIDSDLKKALSNSKNYYERTGKCSYCQMNEWEKKSKKRIVFENREFLVVCPFASKGAFEVIISPKFHKAYFEKITENEKRQLSEAFQMVFGKIHRGLSDPAYNFYLHTAPADGKNHNYYHWHWTIMPKTATWAGFEIGTRMEISTIEPEKAAEYLRKQ